MRVRIHPHIQHALNYGDPVVALESTVISHGLPKPHNLVLAKKLEDTVRSAGALPATIGVVRGELVVGLDEDELNVLANHDVPKASLWNLATLVSQGQSAGTTVATTLHAASLAKIQVFATGGIGGVHDPSSFDESADLQALARYSVVVVCAGAKSILDVGATKERLESLGVPLIGYRSDRLAGFYVPTTDYPVAGRCNSPSDVAAAFDTQQALSLHAALVVSKPVSEGLDPADLDRWTAQAKEEALAQGRHGHALTPYLLARLAELSAGQSVETNTRLLLENAELASEIAVALRQQAAPTAS